MLEAVALEKSYYKRTAVRNVTLQVAPGEIVGLLGPNGAGKTTTFQMMVGLAAPSRGSVLLNKEPITRLPLYRRARMGLSYLPQEASIFRKMTVEQNVLAILEMQPNGNGHAALASAMEGGMPSTPPPPQTMEARAAALLAELNIEHLAKNPAHTLSGGERRRLEITRALAHAPQFLLLDEPFSGIDPIVVGEIQQILFQLKGKGIGILITDHNVAETLMVCDRAYIMHDGEILLSGTPSEIAKSRLAREVYLGPRFHLPEPVTTP